MHLVQKRILIWMLKPETLSKFAYRSNAYVHAPTDVNIKARTTIPRVCNFDYFLSVFDPHECRY